MAGGYDTNPFAEEVNPFAVNSYLCMFMHLRWHVL